MQFTRSRTRPTGAPSHMRDLSAKERKIGMKRVTTIFTACVAAVLLTLGISVGAQDFNTSERTFLTFSGPVELPGTRLEPGTYVFRLADTAGRNVVQVLSQDEKEMLGQWLFIQSERPEVTGETVITFKETNPGATPAVQYWYYPGEKIGKEFVYPKDQAMRIAARTGATVQSTEGEISANSQVTAIEADASAAGAGASADVAVGTTSEPSVSASASADAGVVEGSGLPAEIRNDNTQAQAEANVAADTRAVGTSGDDQASATAGAGVQQESTQARADTLPATASPLALSGLLGLLSLVGAAGIRFFRA